MTCINMKEKILQLRKEGRTYNEIVGILGCSKGTISYHCGKRTGKKKGVRNKSCIECGEKLNKGLKYCNIHCQTQFLAKKAGKEWKLSSTTKRTGLFVGRLRRFLFIEANFKCERCQWTYNFGDGSLPPLEISHKDNDYTNNNKNNLEVLCPNCHAVETRLKPIKKGEGRWSNGGDSRNSGA